MLLVLLLFFFLRLPVVDDDDDEVVAVIVVPTVRSLGILFDSDFIFYFLNELLSVFWFVFL